MVVARRAKQTSGPKASKARSRVLHHPDAVADQRFSDRGPDHVPDHVPTVAPTATPTALKCEGGEKWWVAILRCVHGTTDNLKVKS